MMKSLKNLMLVGLLSISGAMNAALPNANPAPANNPPANVNQETLKTYFTKAVLAGVAGVIAEKIVVGTYQGIKDYLTGDAANKTRKDAAKVNNLELNNILALMDIENKKIALVYAESDALAKEYQNHVQMFNGGINTGLDKKEIQEDIKELRKAMKANRIRSAAAVSMSNARLQELEGRLKELTTASKPQTLAQATQLPTATRQATPELAAKMLAASTARAA